MKLGSYVPVSFLSNDILLDSLICRGGGAGTKIKIGPPDPAPRGSKYETATPDPGLWRPQEKSAAPDPGLFVTKNGWTPTPDPGPQNSDISLTVPLHHSRSS